MCRKYTITLFFASIPSIKRKGEQYQERKKKTKEREKRTRTMRNNPLLPPTTLNPTLIPHKPLNSMKRAPDLKRSNPLQILTLEPQPQLRLRRRAALEACSRQVARRRGQLGQGLRRGYGSEVDVWLYEGVGFLDGGAGEGYLGRWLCHDFLYCVMLCLGKGEA